MSTLTRGDFGTRTIPGLKIIDLNVHVDGRGWFTEFWQRERMSALGVPDLGPVQANLAVSYRRGTVRGMHAEPWDKLVTVVTGSAFAAWLDLRPGPSYGTTQSTTLRPGVSVFIPRGVANGYQTLNDGTVYAYLVNDHWRADATYPSVDVRDPKLGIAWPLPVDESLMSERDRTAPRLGQVGS